VKKEIFINAERSETRVAVLEDGKLAEVFIERETSQGAAGNIYKGRVGKVLPGIQSAFVAVGLERDTFLHVSDVIASHRSYRDYLTPGKRTFRAGRVPDNARIEDYAGAPGAGCQGARGHERGARDDAHRASGALPGLHAGHGNPGNLEAR
jgi:ribonuclease G